MTNGKMPGKGTAVVLVALTGFGLLGVTMLGDKESTGAYVAPPPPVVTVSQPVQRDITEYLEFTGNTEAVRRVEVRARVEGFLLSDHFPPSADVQEGDLLYTIDPRPFEAKLEQALADVSRKQAALDLAESDFQRSETLFDQGATPEAEFVKAKAARGTAVADLRGAKASLAEAELNLSFTEIRAPISGRVGRGLVGIGNLVGANESTHLTTLVQYDPIRAYFSLSEQEILRLMARNEDQGDGAGDEGTDVIHLGLANEPGFPHEGHVDFIDQGVDPETGTLLLRGSFPNPEPHKILPGMFVRIRAPVGEHPGALLIPERALGSDQSGRYVYVVNKENEVELRPVQLGASIDGLRIIDKGLEPDDWIVVKGLLRARPGAIVDPQRQEISATAASTTQ